MKTIYIVTLFILFFSVKTNAQNWALPSSKWTQTIFNPWNGSIYPVDFFVQKDTVVQSVSCTKIVGDTFNYHPNIIYTYLSGDTAYMFVNGSFKPMLYFGAHVGDILLFYTDSTNGFTGIQYLHGRVDSINTILVNGQNIKQFNVSIIDTIPSQISPRQLVYTEKLGFMYTYPSLFYQLFSSVVDANSYGVCNYGDSTINGFWLYRDSNCRTNVGIEDVSNDGSLSVYPSPASDYLHIQTTLGQYHIRLFDLAGRELSYAMNNDEMDIRNLSSGIYFITVSTFGSQIYTRKFVKE